MSWVSWFVDLFLHLDRHLDAAAHSLGAKLYLLIFAIVFCETGLIVWPFLPGDSLLFALGALAATGTAVKLPIVIPLLFLPAHFRALLNYFIRFCLGPQVL